ncbi:MAG: F0F1 ATP synthase subunit B [Planctomycetota bacterium]|nr:F0F1 ATP synthase subunit B [Planctomycetota bacterium]
MKSSPTQISWRARLAALAGPCLLAQAAFAGEGGESGLYLGDLGQALAAVAVFLVLLAILGKWAWKPIIEQLRIREERIEQALQDAEKRHQDAKDLLERYRQRMEQVQAEAQELLGKTRLEADAAKEGIVSAAHNEAQGILRDTRRQIDQAKVEALQELRATTAQLAAEIAVTALGRRLTEDDHRRLIDESLQEIERRTTGGRV